MNTFMFPQDSIPVADRAVALGFFDGVHIGHRAVLHTMLGAARDGLEPTVVTFDELPKMQGVGRLTDGAETDRLFQNMGMAARVTVSFAAVAALSPEDFVKTVLLNTLHAKVVVCGENYRFGAKAAGDAALLCRFGKQYGFAVTVVPTVLADGQGVSATRIRAALAEGDFATANRLLGRPFTVKTPVENGQHLGRRIGAPTINQPFFDGSVLPKFGVYASAVVVDGRVTYGVTNIGVKPTVGGTRPLCETWIPEFHGDLYGQAVPVMPIAFIRAEETFQSVDVLRCQIEKDGETARRIMTAPQGKIRAVLFDFDDTLQNRRTAFTGFIREFLVQQYPHWTAEELEQNAARMVELNCGGNELTYPEFFEVICRECGAIHGMDGETFLEEVQRRFPWYTTLLPNVEEGLLELRRRGYKLGIVTNGYSLTQNRKLDTSGLRRLFDAVVVAGDEGVSKPEGEIFRRAAAYLGLPPQDCVFVGDHPQKDIAGAKAAGMTPVFMLASGFFHSPEDDSVPIVCSVDELTEFLKRM